MSRFQAVRSFLKAAAPAAALALGAACATESHAAAYFLQSDTMDTSRTANIYGPGGYHEYVYMAPLQFTVFDGTGPVGDAYQQLAFCVDIFHDIGLGALNLQYDDNYDLTTNSKYLTSTPFAGGTSLTGAQIVQVGKLVNYGELLFDNAPHTADTVNRLSALQGAIWQVINPGYSVVSGVGAVDGYIADYSGANYASNLTGYGPVRDHLTFITETGKYGTSRAHQSFAFAGVPEPSMWMLMITGFGLTGATLRRARSKLVPIRVA